MLEWLKNKLTRVEYKHIKSHPENYGYPLRPGGCLTLQGYVYYHRKSKTFMVHNKSKETLYLCSAKPRKKKK